MKAQHRVGAPVRVCGGGLCQLRGPGGAAQRLKLWQSWFAS